MSSSDFDEIDECKCELCGQVPNCLNSTGSGPDGGHEVCDDCLPLFKPKENDVCPLPACKIPSHMANKINVLKEDLEQCKIENKDRTTVVAGQISTLNRSIGTWSETVFEMKSQILDKMLIDHDAIADLKSKVEALMTQTKAQSEDYKGLKMENDKTKEENSELKEKLNKVENEFKDFRSSVKSDTDKIDEKEDHSLLQSDLLQISSVNLVHRYDQFQPALTWKIENVREKMERERYEEWSEPFQWTGYPIRAKAKLELTKDDNIGLSMRLEDASDTTEIKLIPNVYYLLKHRKPDETDSHIIRGAPALFPHTMRVTLPFHVTLTNKSWLTDPSYNTDDSATIEVYVESPEMTQRAYSRDGTVEWVIRDHEKRQLFNKEVVIFQESPYFYTGPKGYKMQILLGLTGLGEHRGKGPSAFVKFLNGVYDLDLPRSFPHRTTFTLSDPKDPKRRVVKTVERDICKLSWYQVDLCELKEITELMEEDTLRVRVDIVEAN